MVKQVMLRPSSKRRPQKQLTTVLRFVRMIGRYTTFLLLSAICTTLVQRWADTSQSPWARLLPRPLAECAACTLPALAASSHVPLTLIGPQKLPFAFNYALKQCGAHIVSELTGPTKHASDLRSSRNGDAGLGGWISDVPQDTTSLSLETPPDFVIDGNSTSGHCWEFEGHTAQLGFSLGAMLNISWVSIGHYDDPDEATHSAPRFMVLWGVADGQESVLAFNMRNHLRQRLHATIPEGLPKPFPSGKLYIPLAVLDYSPHLAVEEQLFPVFKEVKNLGFPIGILVLQVLSNWGAPSTRLCHVGIHGLPVEDY